MHARVIWFAPELGGRKSGPPPGPEYRPTVILLNPRSGTRMPPESSLHASMILRFITEPSEDAIAELLPLAPELVEPYLYEGSTFLVMEGARPVGFARMFDADQNPS